MNTLHGRDGRPPEGFGIFHYCYCCGYCGRTVFEGVRHFLYASGQAAAS